MTEVDYIVELTRELVKTKDKAIQVYIQNLIDSRMDRFIEGIKSYDNLHARITNLESRASFQASSRK